MNTSSSAGAPMKIRFWEQLSRRLFTILLLLTIVPLVVVQFITLRQTSDQAQKQVFSQLESVSSLKANELNQWLAAGHSQIRAILAPDTTQNINNLISAPTDEGQTHINGTLANLTSIAATIGKTRLFRDIFLYNADGKVLASSNSADIGKIVTRQPYYTNSLANAYTQQPYYALGVGQLTIILTEPITVNGKLVGVLAGDIDLATLTAIMTERIGLGETGETYLVSSDNNYFLTPSRFDGFSLTRAYHTNGIDKALAGQSGAAIYAGYRNISVLGYYRWIPELQVGLLAEQDVSEALAATQGVLNTSLLIGVVSALVAVVIGSLYIAQVTTPVRELAQAAIEITNGNLARKVQIRERNEIGLLAQAFNQMTDQLTSNLKQLDLKIEEVNNTNADLQVATVKAREAARLKGEFMATMSHELRTPLNAMLGFSSILLDSMGGEIDNDARHMIERIQANSERLLNLINGVLDIAKIEAGRMEIVYKPTDLYKLVDSWRQQMSVLAEQKNLKFRVEIDPAVPAQISADGERLSQIAVNLLSNAFKFTEQGSIILSTRALNDELLIEVKDTGIGIPPHATSLIFEEFRQVDGSSRRAYGGTGLGLAIVRNLCRMMDGSIRVTSEMGQGSTFIVTLPLKPVLSPVAT